MDAKPTNNSNKVNFNSMTSGYLITIEGIDGSGKSTLAEELSSDDFESISDVTFTREPTDSSAGQLLRDVLAEGDNDVMSELFLFMADHSIHVNETIKPALERGELVICDRYIDSRCAYQGYTLADVFDDSVGYVEGIHKPWSEIPDLTILLDIPAEEAVKRTSSGEKYEVEDRLTVIRENYHGLRDENPDRYVTVDATKSPKSVYEEVVDIINNHVETEMV